MQLKIHGTPVPVTGGAAVVLAVVTALALTGGSDPWIAAAACLALGGGMVDDARPLPPWVRVVVQASAGLLLVGGGYRLEPLGVLGAPGLVVATVACCNAVNMVDGQDGLAAGLGAIAALGLAAILSRGSFETAFGAGLGGSAGRVPRLESTARADLPRRRRCLRGRCVPGCVREPGDRRRMARAAGSRRLSRRVRVRARRDDRPAARLVRSDRPRRP